MIGHNYCSSNMGAETQVSAAGPAEGEAALMRQGRIEFLLIAQAQIRLKIK